MANLLVIDDEEPFRSVVALTLRQHGHIVIEASDGDMGVRLAEDHLPDLIICDIFMGHKDGFAVLQALRDNPHTLLIPFIFMTGQGNKRNLRLGMVLGADDFLPKPFSPEELIAAVDARLNKHRAFLQQSETKLATLRDNIGMSLPHEMLTPLQGILGAAEIILTDSERLPPEVVEMAQQIMESGNRLHRTIQHFLIYAQMELLAMNSPKLASFGKSPPLPLARAIRTIATNTARNATRENDLQMRLIEGTVCIAEDLFSNIVGELLNNAFKFSPPGTSVQLVSSIEDSFYRIDIQDAGCGMKPEELAQVGAFMQFQRRLLEQQGSGLGLIIARRLCEFHGGSLGLQSHNNHGTLAIVRLPRAEGAPEEPARKY
jgi:two-component system, sensor histidine kinase and response regulator